MNVDTHSLWVSYIEHELQKHTRSRKRWPHSRRSPEMWRTTGRPPHSRSHGRPGRSHAGWPQAPLLWGKPSHSTLERRSASVSHALEAGLLALVAGGPPVGHRAAVFQNHSRAQFVQLKEQKQRGKNTTIVGIDATEDQQIW